MKNSLYDLYCSQQKSYYDIDIDAKDYFNGERRNEQTECFSFIERHFDKGCKQEALCFPWKDKYYCNGKHVHTVSLYLLGLMFDDLFSQKIKKKLDELIWNVNEWYNYKYTWFLTCLYHDAASSVEYMMKPELPNDMQLSFYLGDLNIQYTPNSFSPRKAGVSLTRFSEDLISNYFRYRTCDSAFDHGIVGGYYLFDRLYKNFIEHTANCNWESESIYINKGVNWRLEHLDHFAYICDAIICHNMWTVSYLNKIDFLKYKNFGLSPLIVKRDTGRLQCSQYPLQYLLCLLDSIEPVKKFKQLSAQKVLQSISVQPERTNDNKCIISILWDSCLKNSDGFEPWTKNIDNLSDWMQLTVEKKDDARILKFNISDNDMD